ncbi:TetR/AcrR family transcriptional regulator [Actinomyces ruminis]|nr:TetR/AcrR family transcriptional regulator [Actinomyces ruminis]
MARLENSAAPLKDAMGDALLELMREKPFKKISAGEIASRAGLGRVTYFRHFSSKEEVLAHKYRTAWRDFSVRHWYNEADDRANAIARFRFCLQVREINDVVYEAELGGILLRVTVETLEGEPPEPAAGPVSAAGTMDAVDRAAFLRRFKAFALFGLIDTWIRHATARRPRRWLPSTSASSAPRSSRWARAAPNAEPVAEQRGCADCSASARRRSYATHAAMSSTTSLDSYCSFNIEYNRLVGYGQVHPTAPVTHGQPALTSKGAACPPKPIPVWRSPRVRAPPPSIWAGDRTTST